MDEHHYARDIEEQKLLVELIESISHIKLTEVITYYESMGIKVYITLNYHVVNKEVNMLEYHLALTSEQFIQYYVNELTKVVEEFIEVQRFNYKIDTPQLNVNIGFIEKDTLFISIESFF
jgi:NAD-specific glutamate dehydrogenase